jgi:hypothetical protein
MALKSPEVAARFVETMEISEEQKDALNHRVLGVWAQKEPEKAFNAWMELDEPKIPVSLLNSIEDQCSNSQKAQKTSEWVGNLTFSPAREQLKSALVTTMSHDNRFQLAAELSMTLVNPIERISQMKQLKSEWQEKFPKDSAKWLGKLSEADRSALEEK